jgi:tetratricopeptide (TPR) repeat protein
MEKNRLLDACSTAAALIALAVLAASCALPRIAVLHDPLTPEEHINLGVSYERSGELDAALKEYAAASRDLPIAYLYVGNVRFQRGEYEEAEAAYRRAVNKTGDPRAYNNLAWLYLTTGKDLEEAERLAGRAVALSPGSADFQDTLEAVRKRRAETGGK